MTDAIQPKRKAKDNPWYRLATLHGVPTESGDEIAVKNRVTWNRWMASKISYDLRGKLSVTPRYMEGGELHPLSDDERIEVESKIGHNSFGRIVNFQNTEFDSPFYSEGFIFPEITFAGAIFNCSSVFHSATFGGDADFESTIFKDIPTFASVTFHGATHFRRATFESVADFRKATFESVANFHKAIFKDAADLDSATFKGVTDFRSVAFSKRADFGGVTFSGRADFSGGIFNGDPDFANTEMKRETSFDNVTFFAPPRCFNAKLHEGTTWHGVDWPQAPKDVEQARRFVDAYERLKLEMDRLKKHGDELKFFAGELACRRVVEGFWPGLPICIYGCLSNYGRSYFRPLLLLVATVLFGATFPMTHFVGFWTPPISDLDHMKQAIGISFANTLGVFGRPLMKPQVLWDLPDWLKAVGTAQTMLGFGLLFLFGLGIRNAFRMK